jgi:Putative zinc-binding metallo-peptidase
MKRNVGAERVGSSPKGRIIASLMVSIALVGAALVYVSIPDAATAINSYVLGQSSSSVVKVVTKKTAFGRFTLDQYKNDSEAGKYQAKFQSLLNKELEAYPAGYLTNTLGLDEIVISPQVRLSGKEVGGTADPFQTRTVYFTVNEEALAAEDGTYLSEIIHHELAHYIYGTRDGAWLAKDAKWDICNIDQAVYIGTSYGVTVSESFTRAIHPKNGFITGYAASNIDEDKAEVFSNMVKYPARVAAAAKNDSELACKVELTKTVVPGMQFAL